MTRQVSDRPQGLWLQSLSSPPPRPRRKANRSLRVCPGSTRSGNGLRARSCTHVPADFPWYPRSGSRTAAVEKLVRCHLAFQNGTEAREWSPIRKAVYREIWRSDFSPPRADWTESGAGWNRFKTTKIRATESGPRGPEARIFAVAWRDRPGSLPPDATQAASHFETQ